MSGPRVRRSQRYDGGQAVAAVPAAGGLALRAGQRAWRGTLSLPDSRLAERLVRGRSWIILIGILLIGIVAVNVALLRLNTTITSNAQEIQLLKRQDSRLQAKASRLSSIDRIQKVAGVQGMVMPQPAEVRYLTTYPRPTPAQRRAAVHAAGFGG